MMSSGLPYLATWTFDGSSRGARPCIEFCWQAGGFHSVFPARSDTLTCSDTDQSSQGYRKEAIPGSSWQAVKTTRRPRDHRPELYHYELTQDFICIGARFVSEPHFYPEDRCVTTRDAENRLLIKGSEPLTEISAASSAVVRFSGSTPLEIPLRSIDKKHGDKELIAPVVGLLANSAQALHIGEDAGSTYALADDKKVAGQEAATDHDASVLARGDACKTWKKEKRCELKSVRPASDAVETRKQLPLVLPFHPAAERPVINQYPLPTKQNPDTSGRPDVYSTSFQNAGNNSARKETHSQLEHGSLAFKAENCKLNRLGCPLGKLGFDVDNCSSKEKKGYVHWRFLRVHQHLDRHMEVGHMTSNELQRLKGLDASHGLPSANTKVLENVAKYFRRAIVTIAIELRNFEALINPYQGWDLCDEKTLGAKHNSCKAALCQFKSRRQHEALVAGDPGLFAGSTVQGQVHNSLPPTGDLHLRAVKEVVPPSDGDYSVFAQSASSQDDLAWGSSYYSVTSADSAQLQSPDTLADDRNKRIDSLVRGIEGMNDAADALQSVGELANTVSVLRENVKIASGRVRTVNRQPRLSHRGDTRTMTFPPNRSYRVSKQAPTSSSRSSRSRQQQQDTQVHRTNFHVHTLSQRPIDLRAAQQPFSREGSLSLPAFQAQMPIPDFPGFCDSSSATDQVSSRLSTPPTTRLDDHYMPGFSVLPDPGYDLTFKPGNEKPSKIQDSEWGLSPTSSSLWLDQIDDGTTLLHDTGSRQQ